MAGMRAFVLSEEIASVHSDSLAATGCPSSQIAITQPTAVPLWKVIVGPRADELYRTRKGPVFLLRSPSRRVCRAGERRAAFTIRLPAGVAPRPSQRVLEGRLRAGETRFTLPALSRPSAFR